MEYFFGARTKYKSACAGQTIKLTVEYRVEGEPVDSPISETHILNNNEIIVICRPLIPILDRFRQRN